MNGGPVCVYMSNDLARKAQTVAAHQGISRSQMIVSLVRDYVSQFEKHNRQPPTGGVVVETAQAATS